MKKSIKFYLIAACLLAVTSSCSKVTEDGKDGSYIEGVYGIQEQETTFHGSTNNINSVWSFDYEKEVLKINGSAVASISSDAVAKSFYKLFVEYYDAFPQKIVFQKDGTISLTSWDDLHEVYSITGKYDMKTGIVSLCQSGMEMFRYKIVSHPGDVLKLEAAMETLELMNKVSAESGKSEYDIIDSSKAVFKKVSEVSPYKTRD